MLQISFNPTSVFEKLRAKYSAKLSAEEQAAIKDVIKGNFSSVWATEGASIGADWDGHSLVKSGALKQDMTSGRGITITNNLITIKSTKPYASYVNKRYRFMALSSRSLKAIASIYGRNSLIQR
jgi:hypothetical protein